MAHPQGRNRRARIWLWVAALLAVAGVVWALLLARADRPEEVLPDEVATSTQLPDRFATHAEPGADGPVGKGSPTP